MNKLLFLIGLGVVFCSASANAQVSEEEVQALRAQIAELTRRLDDLEKQAARTTSAPVAVAPSASQETVAKIDTMGQDLYEVRQSVAAMSWAERLSWKGDFRYRYEHIDEQGKDTRNRNRIRARTSLVAKLADDIEVGVGLATGGDDPVSTNQTLGGGGSTKDLRLDLAYFKWKGLENTTIIGGKFSNFLVRPGKVGLRWDGDWRPEGLGVIWDNGTFFVQGLGTWLEGDSKNGTEFAYLTQAGMKFDVGESGRLTIGGGYSRFGVAGRTPLYGDPDDFYGNSFVLNPLTDELAYAYDYDNIEAFADYSFKLGGKSVALFGVYTVNTDADENDTGYVFGAKYGSVKEKGDWDFMYFYENLEADATIGLLADSDFGGGGSDVKGHALAGSYAFHKAWSFKATYFINTIDESKGKGKDYDRLMLDMVFKF